MQPLDESGNAGVIVITAISQMDIHEAVLASTSFALSGGERFSIEKASGGYLPSKFLLFGTVGASGMVIHLVVLRLLLAVAGTGFVWAQSTATATAMVWNYFLNNTLTYRDFRLVGWATLRGLVSFMLICGLGAVVNVLVARDLYVMTQMWLFAGVAGAVVGALLNYSLTSMFTWGRRLS